MEHGEERPKRYITTLSFSHEAGSTRSLEEAVTQAREVIACAEDHGLSMIDGGTNRTNERNPVESWTYGSEKGFRNLNAEAEGRGEVWDRDTGTSRPLVEARSQVPSGA